jgi:hypothetical protein
MDLRNFCVSKPKKSGRRVFAQTGLFEDFDQVLIGEQQLYVINEALIEGLDFWPLSGCRKFEAFARFLRTKQKGRREAGPFRS